VYAQLFPLHCWFCLFSFVSLTLIVYSLLLSLESDNDPLKVSSRSLILDNPSCIFRHYKYIFFSFYCQSNFLSDNYISRIWVALFQVKETKENKQNQQWSGNNCAYTICRSWRSYDGNELRKPCSVEINTG
jgi:hypothetical protein